MAARKRPAPPPDRTEGGSRRRKGGRGWSGPSGPAPTTEALRAQGGAKRLLYFSPEREAAYRAAAEALDLDPDARGSVTAVWDRALAALLAASAES